MEKEIEPGREGRHRGRPASRGRETKASRPKARPALEGLESRQLLHARLVLRGGPINDQDLRHFVLQKIINKVPVSDRRIAYTTPQGTHVLVTLYGLGSLGGSTVGPDGSLDLVFRGTNSQSGIVGRVSGGTGQASLRNLHDADTPLLNFSGNNVTQVGVVNLKDFDLLPGGVVNLSGGVGKLLLNSVGPNTQVHVKEIPQSTTTTTSTTATAVSTSEVLGNASGSISTGGTTTIASQSSSFNQFSGTTLLGNPSPAGVTPTVNINTGAGTGGGGGFAGGSIASTGGTPSFGTTAGLASFATTPGLLPAGAFAGNAATPIQVSAQVGTTPGLAPLGLSGGGGPGGGGGGPGGGGGTTPVTGGFPPGTFPIAQIGPTAGPGGLTPLSPGNPTGLPAVTVATPSGGAISLATSSPAALATGGTAGVGTNPGGGTLNTGSGTTGGTTSSGSTPGTGGTSTTLGGGVGSTTTVAPSTGTFTPVTGVVSSGQGATKATAKLGSATGVDVVIEHVNGGRLGSPAIGNPQIFGYDPVANALIRFDAYTGAALQTIPVSGLGTDIAGVGLGRNAGNLVALIGNGTTVQAYDAVTGSLVGQFSTANLAAVGLRTIDGIAGTDNRTILFDSTAGPLGEAQIIDVTASLAAGQAVPVGAPFASQREFEFAGGGTGIPGSDIIYALGAAHFDTFQPDQTQYGIMGIFTFGDRMFEAGRAELTGPSGVINAGPPGTARSHPVNALGSIDSELALVTSNQNNVTLYNPANLAVLGSLKLQDPNRIAGLSESFHPELVDAALLDVRGSLRSFHALNAQGLVINDNAGISLVSIHSAQDSAIVGRPVAHVRIPLRRNVTILSTARVDTTNNENIGERNGVIVDPNLRVFGPLSLPRVT